ncbi:hypothetical protein N665_0353s0012 [Sinapis alba]|nr:hypothetical protein N665_0353s0012 [Sinapis alba]
MANHNNLSLLESLPQDLLGEILSRVTYSSREDIRQCVTVSRTISAATQDYCVFNKLSLRPQAMSPLLTFGCYHQLMNRCLQSDNPAAHYIEGLKQYFIHENTILGLFQLKKICRKFLRQWYVYLWNPYVVHRKHRGGKLFLGMLDWETSKRRADRCWRENKKSLRNFIIILKHEYTTNLMNNLPPTSCHINDLDTCCPKCYHYKQMRKFVNFI